MTLISLGFNIFFLSNPIIEIFICCYASTCPGRPNNNDRSQDPTEDLPSEVLSTLEKVQMVDQRTMNNIVSENLPFQGFLLGFFVSAFLNKILFNNLNCWVFIHVIVFFIFFYMFYTPN